MAKYPTHSSAPIFLLGIAFAFVRVAQAIISDAARARGRSTCWIGDLSIPKRSARETYKSSKDVSADTDLCRMMSRKVRKRASLGLGLDK